MIPTTIPTTVPETPNLLAFIITGIVLYYLYYRHRNNKSRKGKKSRWISIP